MTNEKKGFLYVSTGVLVFLLLASVGALVLDIYLMVELDSYQSVIVDKFEYFKGTPEYEPIIQKMKQRFIVSAALSIVVSCATATFIFLRKKNKKA